MKILLFIAALLFTVSVFAQEEKNPVVEFLKKRGYTFPDSTKLTTTPDTLKQWPDTVFYNTTYKSKLLGSPTIPVSFSRLELVDGKYILSPTISIGYGYAWFKGKFIFNESDKITVDPTLFFGLVGDVSLNNNFDFKKLAGFFIGSFVGFGNFSLFEGYDFIANSPSIGIGGRIDLYTIYPKSLRPYGKVRETWKHKKSSPPIENE